MTEISFSNVVIVAAVAFAAPLALGLIRKLRLPAVVLEIVLGIAVGLGVGQIRPSRPGPGAPGVVIQPLVFCLPFMLPLLTPLLTHT
jgi:hypothetical protein